MPTRSTPGASINGGELGHGGSSTEATSSVLGFRGEGAGEGRSERRPRVPLIRSRGAASWQGGMATVAVRWRRARRHWVATGEGDDIFARSPLLFFFLFFCFFKTSSTLGILLRPLNYFRNYENI